MQKTYEYLGNEHFVDLIRASFGEALERRGYHLEVGAAGPGGPRVYGYRRDDTVVAVAVDDRAGEKWEAKLLVETEGDKDELDDIVSEAVTRLLADLSTRLIESVLDDSCRSAVARELSRAIATLE